MTAARGSLSAERADLEASEASPEALAAGQAILEELMRLMDLQVTVEVQTGDTSRLNVVGEGEAKEALGALIGRKGERLSALQHLVNLMLSKKMGDWTRVLVDVEDYRGRRERQLRDLATRAAERVDRDRQDAPARADAGPRAALGAHRAARPPGRRHAVHRRGAESADRGPATPRLNRALPRAAASERRPPAYRSCDGLAADVTPRSSRGVSRRRMPRTMGPRAA